MTSNKQGGPGAWLRRLLKRTEDAVPDDEDVGDDEEAPDDREQVLPPTIIEWSVRGVSLLLLLALVGYVGWHALQPARPTRFTYEVDMGDLREVGEEWALPASIRNEGDTSVLDLKVVGELSDGGAEPVDEAEVTLPLLGARESADFTLWFSEDPREFELEWNVDGYHLP